MSMSVLFEPLRNRPKCRVELHVHLDGAIRYETIWEMMRKKDLKLPGDGSLKALIKAVTIDEPRDLAYFLAPFHIYMPAFVGDLEAIERFSYEFVEDQAKECVAYCEARYCPHLLLPPKDSSREGKELTADDIVKATLKGFERGEREYNTKVRLILCCIRGLSQFSWDILRLCEEFRDKGVVGIDIAGDEAALKGEVNTPLEMEVFTAAKDKGIHRTVHAGEAGPAVNVQEALDNMHAERIGHGYRVLEDEDIYRRCLVERVHFEMCPHSSYLTGSMNSLLTKSRRHPILRMAEDRASFSISTDDPVETNSHLTDEYNLLQKWGFTEAQLIRANLEAARKSFLPDDEKIELLEILKTSYGISTENSVEKSRPVSDVSDIHVLTPAPTPDLIESIESIEIIDSSKVTNSESPAKVVDLSDSSLNVVDSTHYDAKSVNTTVSCEKLAESTDSARKLAESTYSPDKLVDTTDSPVKTVDSPAKVVSKTEISYSAPENKTPSKEPLPKVVENKVTKKVVTKSVKSSFSPKPSVKIATWEDRL